MRRVLPALIALLCAAAPAAAQEDYQAKREQLAKEIEARQKELATTRGQRAQLQAKVDSMIAQLVEERARSLVLSGEQNSLQQLDALLTTSQDNLLAQRERFAALAGAVEGRTGSMLVVTLRADSSTTAQTISSAVLEVDSTASQRREYNEQTNRALRNGAVDQLFRSQVVPAAHAVALQVVVDGRTLSETVQLSAAPGVVTYVQFAVRDGRLVPTMWTSRGTTP